MNILLLDPCKDVRDLLCEFLKFHGHNVLAVDDPASAYSICVSSDIHVLISEYFPNNSDYSDLFTLLKEKSLGTKVIILSSTHYTLTDLDGLLSVGINCIFHKPTDPKILLNTV